MNANGQRTSEYFRGTIREYDQAAGFGFIQPDESQGLDKLLLVHSKSLRSRNTSLEVGDRVLFMTELVPTGILATDVHPELVEDETTQASLESVSGIVKDFNVPRSFGFIRLSDKREAFFHISYVADRPERILIGSSVTCNIVRTERGLQAQNVTIQDAPFVPNAGSDYLAQAILARDNRQYDQAVILYERGIRETPSVQLILSYAAMEKNRHRTPDAIKIYETGIRLFPENAKLREDLGILAASQKDYRTGIMRLEEALAICRKSNQGGEKGVLVGLARTHYQIESVTSLLQSIRYYTQAQTLFGQGLTRLPEADLLRLNLARIRTQHHRGNLTATFLTHAGFGIVKAELLNRVTEGADLIVEVNASELQESYGIGRYLLVRSVFKSDVTLADLEDLDASIVAWSRRGLADDQLAIMVVASLPQELQRLLSQRIEDRRRQFPAIVPIQQNEIETEASPLIALRASLDRWLYRRDLFAINSPVDGRRFFGRDKPLAQLRESITASIPTGLFGLRKVGKTSLLKETQRRSEEMGDIVLYLDLSRVPSDISDCRWIYWKLGAELKDHASRLPLQGIRWRLGGEFQDFLDIPSSFPVATAFDSDLTRLLYAIRKSEYSPRPKVVLLLDEIERLLPNKLGKAGFEGFFEFFSYLRGIAQENPEFVLMVTGANAAVSEAAQFQGRDNPAFNYFKEVYLQLLEFNECAAMLKVLGRGMGVQFDPKAIDGIYAATGGHPFFTRQFCSFITQQHSERPLVVRHGMLGSLIDRYLEVRSDDFQEIAERLERDFPGELEICVRLAQAGGAINRIDADNSIRTGSAVRHLIGYQLMQVDRSKTFLKISMFSQWLEKRYKSHV
jgi:cold shock CspA family protein/tetratricopeptide (TPR) repeat protein